MTLSTPTGAGNVTTASAGVASSVTLTKPSNTADGDLLVAALYWRNSAGTPAPPSGWSQIGPLNTVNETFALYAKPIPSAAAEVATSYDWPVTGTGSQRVAGIMFRVLGANLSAIQDSFGSLAAYTGTTSTVLPGLTANTGYTLLIAYAINNAAISTTALFTAPGGMTTVGQVSADNGGAISTIWVGTEVRSAAGATGTRTPTISPTAQNSGGFMVAVTGIPALTSAPNLGPDVTVESRSTVTLTASINGSPSTWNWAQTAGTHVTLSGTGSARTFTTPATIDGDTLTFTATASDGSTTSPSGSVNVDVRAHQLWVNRGGTWQPFSLTMLGDPNPITLAALFPDSGKFPDSSALLRT